MITLTSRRSRGAVALGLALTLAAGAADARPGGGSSFGSRGSRPYSAPAGTAPPPPTARPARGARPRTLDRASDRAVHDAAGTADAAADRSGAAAPDRAAAPLRLRHGPAGGP